jgi:hypothetical protein
LKPWQLNKRLQGLSSHLADSAKTETRIDWTCLTSAEQQLFEKVDEVVDAYAPKMPPQDVIEKNADLWYKGLEIIGKRTTEMFVKTVPAAFCCDELEQWYFQVYFYNFMLDWTEQIEELRKMPRDRYYELLRERREMGLLDRVFKIPKEKSQKIAVDKEAKK